MKRLLILLFLVGCGEGYSLDDAECPPEGTELTYENFGEGFMQRECQWCHGSWVEERHGAPYEYSFDDLDSVRHFADRIFDRSAGDSISMPPGPEDPPEEERLKLEEWLACGAP